jgi:hypothetical protein
VAILVALAHDITNNPIEVEYNEIRLSHPFPPFELDPSRHIRHFPSAGWQRGLIGFLMKELDLPAVHFHDRGAISRGLGAGF